MKGNKSMEEIIVNLLESTLVGGAFVFLLWRVTTTFENSLNGNTEELKRITGVLVRLDLRMESLEKRIADVEKGRSETNGGSR